MGRWEPNARERLQHAAMELFLERGYERTSVGDIAARAELAPRTFFRYFSDKREVLFSGTEALETSIAAAIAGAPKSAAPLDVVALGLAATSPVFEAHRAIAHKRQALVASHAELRERELSKSTQLAATVAAGLVARGVAPPTAALLSATGMVLFHSAFMGWIADGKKRDFAHHIGAALDELRQLTAAGQPPRARKPRKPAPARRPRPSRV